MVAKRRIAQHKRFMPYSTHPNPSLTLRTSFMLETLSEIAGDGKDIYKIHRMNNIRGDL